jgi:hypothetical protein
VDRQASRKTEGYQFILCKKPVPCSHISDIANGIEGIPRLTERINGLKRKGEPHERPQFYL